MAKNKAKMNKFVTGVATAAMVATAVVPVASAAGFNDLGDNVDAGVKADIDKAVTLGFFKEAAKFNPSAQITRGQAALTLARYIAGGDDQVENYAIEHDLESKVTLFNDIPVSYKTGQGFEKELYYASLVVKNAGAFTQLNLNPAGPVTRSQMAKIVTQTFGLEKAEDYVSTITDIDHLDAATKGFIETIASQNVTIVNKFMPAGAVTRSQMASFLVRANDAANPTPEPEITDVKVQSVMAINSTGVTVTIEAPTKDIVDAEVVVKNTAGQVYATKSATIKAGATTATFQFATPLTVSPTEGWTVNGVKYVVAELAIAQVERLTDNGKYLEVLFNKPLTSLEVSELAIRNADTLERVGVEKVTLASDGLSAQITLLGSEDAVADDIIAARQDYTLSITKAGKVTSKVFNLDAVVPNVTVTTTNAKENQVNGLKLAQNVAVDFEDVLGRTATYWVNKDNFITRINVQQETVKYDAIELELKTDGFLYVTTATEDKSYRMNLGTVAKPSKITTKVAAGNFVANLSTLVDGDKFASAKLVYDKQGNVKSIVAIPTFTNQLLVSKVNGNIIEAHGNELNLKDYTIIKEGKTIVANDIKVGDVVHYNSTSKVAEVYTNTITEKIASVFNGEFKVGDKVYPINTAQTLDEDGKVTALTQDLIEGLEASKKAVTLSFNRAGDLVFVTGEKGEVTTAKTTSYLTKDATAYDFKASKFVSLETQNAKGEKATVEVDTSKLKSVTFNGNVIKTGDLQASGANKVSEFTLNGGSANLNQIAYKTVLVSNGNPVATTNIVPISSLTKGQVVDVVKNTDGVIVGLNITTAATLATNAKITDKVLNVTTIGNKQIVSSTPVFVENTDRTITSTTWGQLDRDITDITTSGVKVYAKYNKDVSVTDIDYVVIPAANLIGAVEATDVEAVVADVRYNTDSEVAYLKLAVNGTIKEYPVNLTGANKLFTTTVGSVVKASINNKSGAVQTLASSASDIGTTVSGVLDTTTVKVAAGEFVLNSNTYTRASTGIQVYEVVGTGTNKTIETRAFSDLANLKANNAISISTVAVGSKYVDTVVITTNADGVAPVAPGAPTGIAFTDTNSDGIINATELAALKLGFTAANGSTVAVAITDGTTTLNYSTTGTGAAQTIDVSADVATLLENTNITATVTSSNNAGTASATSSTVQVDKTAPLATKTTDTPTSLGLTMSETSTVAITSTATLASGETVSATGTAGTTETFTVTSTGAVNGDTFEFTVTDTAGNVSTYDATFTTSWAVVVQP